MRLLALLLFAFLGLFAASAVAQPTMSKADDKVCTHCLCGCTETGQCTCKDCDHPLLAKAKVGKSEPDDGCEVFTTYRDAEYKVWFCPGRLFVVFVGCPVRRVPGAVVCGVKELAEATSPSVVIGRREIDHYKAISRIADLPIILSRGGDVLSPTIAEILAAGKGPVQFNKPAVVQAATVYQQPAYYQPSFQQSFAPSPYFQSSGGCASGNCGRR